MKRLFGVLLLLMVWPGAAAAQNQPGLPTNDLQGLLSLTGGQTPLPVAVQQPAEPALTPVPEAQCDANSTPLAGMQGRVTREQTESPEAERGWACNLKPISNHPTPGGFRVWRYVDRAGHECAFYDASLLGPLNVVSLVAGPGQGVVVLDMSDPAHPKQTALLTDPGFLSPHEALNLNVKRGLLASESGSVGTEPSVLSIYDVSQNCLVPERLSNTLIAPVGHESGFSPDGNTFWIGGVQGIVPVDVTDPRAPKVLLTINAFSHGVNLSADGNLMFGTNVVDGGLTIYDVSEIQARKPDPHVYELSRLVWTYGSIPQNTNPMTIDGHKYLLEYDEFAMKFNPPTFNDEVGAARIIDIEDPAKPRVVSNLRLAVNQREAHNEASNDPNFVPGSQTTYSAHYCNIPRAVDPEIVACSFLNSGLRIFDIRDPEHPREVAYFVSPPAVNQGQRSDAAFSQPDFDAKTRDVWYSDAASGFWTVRLDKRVWPQRAPGASCRTKRRAVFHRVRRGSKLRATVNGKRAKTRRRGRNVIVRARPGARVKLVVSKRGQRTKVRRHRMRPC